MYRGTTAFRALVLPFLAVVAATAGAQQESEPEWDVSSLPGQSKSIGIRSSSRTAA